MPALQHAIPSVQSERRVWLSRGLVALCRRRLEQILQHCDPSDLPLASFLKERIAAEEESADSLKRLDRAFPRDGDVEFRSKECEQILSGFLPSAFSRSGEGFMDRDAALHFVEILEAERQTFFSRILEGPSGDPPGDRLKVESDRSADRLRLVRTILLPPPNSSERAAQGRSGADDRRSWGVSVSGHVNDLRASRSAGTGPPLSDLRIPVAAGVLRDLRAAARDALGSDEPLAKRFIHEFADLRRRGTRDLEDVMGVARVGLAWLLGGHARRGPSKSERAPSESEGLSGPPLLELEVEHQGKMV